MAYHKNDPIIGLSLDRYGEWCESELKTISQLAGHRPLRVILDVGAHIGNHTVFFAQLSARYNGEVHSFEAQRGCFVLLCCNLALNGLQRVAPHHAVVSDKAGSLGVPMPRQDADINFGAISLLRDVPKSDAVTMIMIDDLKLDGCDLIKTDIEGMESKR